MADILNASGVSYSVQEYPELFIKAMKNGSNAIDHFTVIPNVTKDAVITKFMGVNDILQEDGRQCAWEPSEGQTLGEKTVSVKNYKVNVEECLEKLDNLRSKQIFESDGTNSDMPQSVEEALRNDILRSVGLSIAKAAFANSGELIGKLAADSDVVKVQGTTLTAQNIISEIEKVVDALPEEVLADAAYDNQLGAAKLFISVKAGRLLRKAAGVAPTDINVLQPRLAFKDGKYYFDEVEIVVVAALDANTMVAASKANLFFVTNLLDEATTLDIERGRNIKDRNTLYGAMAFRMGFDYVFGDEVVLYQ